MSTPFLRGVPSGIAGFIQVAWEGGGYLSSSWFGFTCSVSSIATALEDTSSILYRRMVRTTVMRLWSIYVH